MSSMPDHWRCFSWWVCVCVLTGTGVSQWRRMPPRLLRAFRVTFSMRSKRTGSCSSNVCVPGMLCGIDIAPNGRERRGVHANDDETGVPNRQTRRAPSKRWQRGARGGKGCTLVQRLRSGRTGCKLQPHRVERSRCTGNELSTAPTHCLPDPVEPIPFPPSSFPPDLVFTHRTLNSALLAHSEKARLAVAVLFSRLNNSTSLCVRALLFLKLGGEVCEVEDSISTPPPQQRPSAGVRCLR